MDDKSIFMNNVLGEMQYCLDKRELEILKKSLIKELEHYSLAPKTQLVYKPDTEQNTRLIKLFVASKRLEGASEATIHQYVYETTKLMARLHKDFKDVSTIDVQFYLSEYEHTHHVSRCTIDNMRKAIKGVFIWLVDNKYLNENPLSGIRPIAFEQKTIEILDDDEIFDIREASRMNLRTRAIVELLLSTGIRVSELCAIDRSDVDLESGEILIHRAKKRKKLTQKLYLTSEAKRCIADYLVYRNTLHSPDEDALFISNRNNGRRCNERLINGTLKEVEEKAGITKHLTVHTFRKTLASLLHKRGMSSLDISIILGHADTRMSERYYIGIRDEDVKRNYYKYR